jgi:hypothetical protein
MQPSFSFGTQITLQHLRPHHQDDDGAQPATLQGVPHGLPGLSRNAHKELRSIAANEKTVAATETINVDGGLQPR